MKISKLFHWLYAIVMLLPIFAITTTCLVNTFNDSPNTNTETHIEQQAIYYNSNEVTDSSSLVSGNVYYYTNNFVPVSTGGVVKNLFFINVDFFKTQFPQYTESQIITISCNINQSGNPFLAINGIGVSLSLVSTPMYFVLDSIIVASNVDDYIIDYIKYTENKFVKNYQDVEVIEYTQNNIFYYAVDKVTQSPLFNWAYNSFLVQPFAYIVVLFSMPTNSPIVMLLSYWLAVSIIWLVFDLIMYIPLLVHRWLDKGVLE